MNKLKSLLFFVSYLGMMCCGLVSYSWLNGTPLLVVLIGFISVVVAVALFQRQIKKASVPVRLIGLYLLVFLLGSVVAYEMSMFGANCPDRVYDDVPSSVLHELIYNTMATIGVLAAIVMVRLSFQKNKQETAV